MQFDGTSERLQIPEDNLLSGGKGARFPIILIVSLRFAQSLKAVEQMMGSMPALSCGADEPGGCSLEDAALGSVSGYIAHETKQLPEHPAAMSVEPPSLAEFVQIVIESDILPPFHLVPCEPIVRQKPVGDLLQRGKPPVRVAGDSVPDESCQLDHLALPRLKY
jgi:hypothetical protein